ncbi:Stage II sporulation E family protein [Desulforamulus reducens MI-1]|uniref:Stage II sporulation E family protein n=1 Tax=Desulforamulus reducens (strain ATCC BAA-1160 / DSM 100696 / MI-1) TaxID=349161 RepID=A4J5L3_DESRM|nr:SpoIIE family protein phosphatase [Desulforamulus reducens]ABO50366.1 Stage II sporulation E family protein [Desulforamulus reducens MI-1]
MNKGLNEKDQFVRISSMLDASVMKITIFATVIIVFSMLLVGAIAYTITEKEIVNKLKTKDLVNIAEAISAKIDGRIERAKETSILLAKDPEIINWVSSAEKNKVAEQNSLLRIAKLAREHDYSNSFIVSNVTKHYWDENCQIIDTMLENDPDDSWFFDVTKSNKPVSLVIDYNNERKDTFVFVNALMGDVKKPLAVVGVGLSLGELSKDFQSFKYGEKSDLWLVDNKGNIYLSDNINHNGKNISKILPMKIASTLLRNIDSSHKVSSTLEYQDSKGALVDIISYPIKSSDWKLLVQIPRSESVSLLNTIKFNTLSATGITLIAITIFFFLISRYLANPYKRTLQLNQELEAKITERTKELFEKNSKLMDSIDYAKRIQESTLPSPGKLTDLFKDHFLLWRPKDLVGGDFYWTKKFNKDYLVAVGDCTGHGVPGAFMTMLTVSILNQIADLNTKGDPALLLKKLNVLIKQTLNQETEDALTDDGLDIGLCYFDGSNHLIFAGAKMSLFIRNSKGIEIIQGNKKSIGYIRTAPDYPYTNSKIDIESGDLFYLTTDGYLDQNGGLKDYSFGKNRFLNMIEHCNNRDLSKQGKVFLNELLNYMGEKPQRDDITVIGFRIS